MRNKSILVLVALVFSLGVKAETITIFDSNAIISNGESYDTVVVKGDSTVVEMTGGDANKVIVMNDSTLNMSGGNISSSYGGLLTYDSASVNLFGGNIARVNLYSTSKINILGNSVVGACFIWGSAELTMSSHNATASGFELCESGKVYFSAGTTGYIHNEITTGNSLIKVSGGNIGNIRSIGPCVLDISGGAIDEIWVEYREQKVNIIGYDLTAVPYGGTYGYGEVRGWWNDHTYFTIPLNEQATYSHITLYDGVIPSECVSKPESDLSGDCKVNSIDLAKICSEWLYDGTE